MQFSLAPLPYALDALEPHISKEQLYFHYEKHHRGYVKKLDAALRDPQRRALDLEEIVRSSDGGTFNAAAQIWNHQFLWQSLTPDSTRPKGVLQRLLDEHLGGIEGFRKAFADAATSQFGSGWTWLVMDPRSHQLLVTSTHDARTPLTTDLTPLITLDVWEHAYYLDYKNDRGAYVGAFLHELINWDFARANVERCLQSTGDRAIA